MKIMQQKIMLVFCICICFSISVLADSDEGKIIATYGDSWKTENPSGWRHFWSKNGEIGNPANYIPLTYKVIDAKKRWWLNYYTDKSGKLKAGYVNTIRASGTYVISSYKFAKDYKNVWVTNGNICNMRKGKISVKIFLNKDLKFSSEVENSRTPTLFQCELGDIKKDDIVYVAAGGKTTVYRLYYTLESFPAEKKPNAPANIISPEADAAAPKRAADGRPDPSFIKKHQQQCDLALKSHPELVFLGDSITERWNFKTALNGKLLKYKPANFGIGGDWIQNVLWRLENGVMDKVKPKVLVLLIGTNNITHHFSASEVADGTFRLIKYIQKQTPETKIILMGIFPRGKFWLENKNKHYKTVKDINAKLAEFAKQEKDITFIDIGDKLVKPDGTITKDVMPDYLHISSKEYDIWAEALIPVLEEIYNKGN